MHALDLEARYQSEVNTYISSHAVALHMTHRSVGQEGVRHMLRLQSRYEASAFHRNHWWPTLLRALASHEAFTGGGFADVLPLSEEILKDLKW